MTALCFGACQTIILGSILIFKMKDIIYNFGINKNMVINDIKKLYLLSWILTNNGVIFGDTAGEGVGAFLGKHRFKVRGFIGQENQRSYEGCFGVFIFTLITDIIGISFFSNLFQDYLLKTIGFVFLLSLGTMILEMVSFKGTDNLSISLYSLFLNMIFFSWVF